MSPRALIRGGVLSFASVDAADQGEYSCKALNTHGEHTARVALVVHSRFRTCWCWRLTEGGRFFKKPLSCVRVRPRRSRDAASSPGQPPKHRGPRRGHAEVVLPGDGRPHAEAHLAEERGADAPTGETRVSRRVAHVRG